MACVRPYGRGYRRMVERLDKALPNGCEEVTLLRMSSAEVVRAAAPATKIPRLPGGGEPMSPSAFNAIPTGIERSASSGTRV